MILSNPGDNKTFAEKDFNLSGTVIEEASGDVLAGASIKITGLDKEIYSDLDGKFNVNGLKPGKYSIEISYLSYSTTELTGIQLDSEHNKLLVRLK